MKFRLTTSCELYYLPTEQKEVSLLKELGFTINLANIKPEKAEYSIVRREDKEVEIEIKSLKGLVDLEKSFRESVRKGAYGGIIINDDLINVYDGYIE